MLKEQISSLFDSSHLAGRSIRGMAKIASGSLLARIIGFVIMPILSRIYSPEDFGIMAVYTALILLLQPLLSLRYTMAIPLPKQDHLAMNLTVLSLAIGLVAAAMMSATLALFPRAVLEMAHAEVVQPWIALLILSLPVLVCSEILSAWATRKRSYRLMARREISSKIAGDGTKVALGLLAIKPLGLLIGNLVVQAGATLGFLWTYWSEFVRLWPKVNCKRIWFLARYYSSFPVYRMPSQVLLVYGMQAPVLFTAGTYGVATSGQFGLAISTMAIPLSLIGSSMGRAFYAEAAKIGRHRPDEIYRALKQVQFHLFFAALVPTAVLALWGKSLFIFVFGTQWALAGDFSSLLSISLLTQFVASPVMQVLNIMNRQGSFLIINVVRAALVSALIWAADYYSLAPREFVLIYSWLMASFYILMGLFTSYVLKSASLPRVQ